MSVNHIVSEAAFIVFAGMLLSFCAWRCSIQDAKDCISQCNGRHAVHNTLHGCECK